MYIVDAHTARQIRGYLRDVGINIRDAEKRRQLLFLTRDDAYMREGVFNPQGMISLLHQETQKALGEGFSGLRVTGEMTWALRGLPGSERLIEYETLLNEFFPGSPCIGLCQYDARRFPADILLDVLRTHPIAVVGTRIYANVYYISPEELQAGKSDQFTLDRWLLTLEENQRLTDGLRERTRALEERVKELECLRQVRELVSRDDLSVTELLQAVLDPIRSGWRWPERIGVRIEHGGSFYATEGFEENRWRIATPILQHETQVGTLEVAYPDPPPEPDPFLPEERSLLHDLSVRLGHALASRHDMGKILHLNGVLRAIRNVNQLIVREHDVGALIQHACELLVEARGVVCTWIALVDERGQPTRWAGTGTSDEMAALITMWRKSGPPLCVEQAISGDGLAIVEDAMACTACPMSAHCGPSAGVAVPLSHAGRIHGVLVAGAPSAFTGDPEELDLFREIAADLGYALSTIRLEEDRREGERRLAQLMANLPGIAYRCRNDRDWTMEFVSEGCRDLLGYEPEALVGNRDVAYGDLIHPDDRQAVWDDIHEAVARRAAFTLTYRMRTATGEERWVWERGVAVASEGGEITLEGFITDITELVKAQATLQESEERYRTLFEQTGNPILVIDREGIYIQANDAACAFLERTREEIVGRNVVDTIPPGADATDVMRLHRDLWERGGRIETDYWVNGKQKTLDLTITPGMWKGKPVVWGLGTDITDRKQAAEALELAEQKYRLLVGHLPAVVYTVELGEVNRTTYISPQVEALLGYSPEEWLADPDLWISCIHPDDRERAVAEVRRRDVAGQPLDIEYRVVARNGGVRWLRNVTTLVDSGNGALRHSHGVLFDITNRRQAELDLLAEKNWSEAIICGAPNIIIGLGENSRILIFNRYAEKLTGYAAEEVLGKEWIEVFIPEEMRREIRGIWEQIVAGGYIEHRYENAIQTKAGEQRVVRWSNTVLTEDSRFKMVLSIGEDITDRRRAEEERARLVQRLTVLHRVSQEVARASLGPEQVYATIHRATGELMPADAFVISLRTGGDEAEAVYLWDRGGRSPPARILKGEGLTWQVITAGKPVVVRDMLAEETPGIHFGSDERVRSILAVPLTTGAQAIGMLSTQSYRPDAYSEEDLGILGMLAAHAAAAIESARLLEHLRASEERYRELVEDVTDIIFAADGDGIVTYISPAVQALGGYAPEEITGRSFAQFVHADDRPMVAEALQRTLADHPEPLEHRVIGKVGQVVWVRSLSKAFYENGRPMGIRGVLSDITERKLAEEELRESYAKVRRMFDDIVNVLASTIELRDPYTAGHQRRVAELVAALGSELDLPPEGLNGLRIAGLVHDVGKVVVPAEILSKPGQLSELEMYLVRAHPEAGFNVLRGIDFPWPVAEIVYQHHERLDGSGYPRGLKGDDVLFEARILAIADVVEAMSSHRPYRPALGIEAALAEIEAGKDRLYDPRVVDACVSVFRKGFTFNEDEGRQAQL